MKRIIAMLVILAMLCTSCASENGDETEEISQENETLVQYREVTEPPLTEYYESIAVPDFLTSEQQNIYRHAVRMYNTLFGSSTTDVDMIKKDDESTNDAIELPAVEVDGHKFYPAWGRYEMWDDFYDAVSALFTEDFFNSKNDLGDGSQIYMNVDGRLYHVSADRGCGGYEANLPETFTLISASETEIEFTVTGYYSCIYPQEGESYEERDLRLATSYEYTQDFPIRMVLTDEGWVFDEFHTPSADGELLQ